PFARDRVEKLRLAVAGNASDGDHFAPLHIKRNALERHGELALGRQTQIFEAEPGRTSLLAARRVHHMDVAADHQFGEARGRLPRRIDIGDDLAVAEDRRVVAEVLHLLQAVADIDDRAAFFGETPKYNEKLIGFLRGQDRRRLVHDQKLWFLEQAAHDLDALALANREIGDNRPGSERQTVFLRHPRDL